MPTKRELFIHFAFWFSFFVFVTLFKNYFIFDYWPFWIGGILGIFLPYLDRFLKTEELIFHTIFFQIIFLVLTFWILTSSGSLFGKGLVLSFALHLSVDQLAGLQEEKNLGNLNINQSKTYWMVTTIIVLVFGFLL
ncbi:MAG TPA: hypothetical protein VL401_01815 [Alphaproteobacteria bacterium]|jgi:hypothetical protein|nr:hypothetical protein [Alphaproteobacteria bacterium]